jgi:hypothetical protein
MEYFILYLCSIADSIADLFTVFGILGSVAGVIILVMNICANNNDCKNCYDICAAKIITKRVKLNGKKFLTFGFICVFLACIVPNKKDCYAIFGVGTVLNYVNNSEEAKQMPDNAMKAVNRYLESLAPNDSIQ